MNKPFAEIIESSLDHYIAQCWQWNYFPRFGSLVFVNEGTKAILGIVTHIQTGSIDPTRTPFPYQKTEAELLAEQPQIFEFLKTTFTVQVVGYQEQSIYYVIPPTPCKIHTFVAPCPPTLTTDFFSRADFLHVLFGYAHNISNLDELLVAIIKQLIEQKSFNQQILDSFCQSFTLLTGNDYRRLKLFLNRLGPLLA